MTIQIEKLSGEMLALPRDVRVMADRLVESLALFDTDIDALWAKIAQQRRDEVRSGHVQTISADEVRVRIRALLEK